MSSSQANDRFAVRKRGSRQFFLTDQGGNVTGAVSVDSGFDTSGSGGVGAGESTQTERSALTDSSVGDLTQDENVLTVDQDTQIRPGDSFEAPSGRTAVGNVGSVSNETGFGSDVSVGGGLRFNNRNTVQGSVTTTDQSAFDNTEAGDVTGNVVANDTSSVTNRGNIQGSVETRDQSSFANKSSGRVENDVAARGGSSVTNAGEIGRNVSVQDTASFENQSGGVVANNVSLVDNARGRFRNNSRVGGNVSAVDNSLASFERRAEVGGQIRGESESNIELPEGQSPGGGRFDRGAGAAGGIRIGDQSAGASNERRPTTRPIDTGASSGALGRLQGGGSQRRRLLG